MIVSPYDFNVPILLVWYICHMTYECHMTFIEDVNMKVIHDKVCVCVFRGSQCFPKYKTEIKNLVMATPI